MKPVKQKKRAGFVMIKESVLERMKKSDKSSKGSVDDEVLPLCNAINRLNGLATTSSCSGRISVVKGEEGEKTRNAWLFKSHTPVNMIDLLSIKLPQDLTLFKMEGAIIHVACESIEKAKKLIEASKSAGIKRAAIISLRENKIMVEIISGESLCFPYSINKKLLISQEHLEICLEVANKKLRRAREKLKKLENAIIPVAKNLS
ncbi:MAG TPA: hypothetical protein ENN46_02050 [Candidatus Woesearchaeota archaeon]|nr:hypothetical protein [Candidatus Woesearchaeota archaeon]